MLIFLSDSFYFRPFFISQSKKKKQIRILLKKKKHVRFDSIFTYRTWSKKKKKMNKDHMDEWSNRKKKKEIKKKKIENNVFPIWYNEKRHGFIKEKKKELSHENKRRLIIHLRRRNRGRRVSHSHSQIYEKTWFHLFKRICRFKTQRAFPIVQTTLKSNALSYTIFIVYIWYTYMNSNQKFKIFEFSITIIIVRAASRLYFDIYTYVTVISN